MRRPTLVTIIILLVTQILTSAQENIEDVNQIPVADAGLPVYASEYPAVLDGTGSYDPDNSGELLYSWEQISGPILVIADSNTATPQVSGFVQTDSLQICRFKLTVYDGQYESLPDVTEVRIFPYYDRDIHTALGLENYFFDPNKPTFIFFGGGDCLSGSGAWNDSEWNNVANILSPQYRPDNPDSGPTYYKFGDMIVQYLSEVAPNYNQMIQTSGASTGGQPAIDVAICMNLTYKDARYNVNRVTFLDGRCRNFSADILTFIDSSVDGELCWLDTCEGTGPIFFPGILNVQVAINDHGYPGTWYKTSLMNPNMNDFNGGIVAGAYWSVVGPGKNLQLAKTPHQEIYKFHWEGSTTNEMQFYDEANFPAKLPEPITLVGPVDIGDPVGAVLTCQVSENAVGYQLLFGSDPHHVMDYTVVSDTPAPPDGIITTLPFEETWWTVKARDEHGSTIYADPKLISELNLTLPVTNLNTSARYGYIQDAIDEAAPGDEIILGEGTYYENIDLKGKNLILRSVNPEDPDITAATIISGNGQSPAVNLSSGIDSSCILAGLTITGAGTGIQCITTTPSIKNCFIKLNKGSGIKLLDQSNPTIVNCLITDNSEAGVNLYQVPARVPNSATIINCTICKNRQQGIWSGKPTVTNSIIYLNSTQIEGNLATVTYSDIQGSRQGEGNIDTDPLFADPANGDYHLMSQAGRWDPISRTWEQDDISSLCIDAGDPASDIGLEPEPNGSVINMGAYGGTAQASKSQ